MSETYFKFPQCCCVCMKPFHTNQLIIESKSIGATYVTSQIYVPVCNECKAKHFDSNSSQQLIIALVLGLLGGLIGLFIGMDSKDFGWFGGIIAGGFVGAMIAAFFITIMNKNLPVRIIIDWQSNISMKFDNREYQKSFDEMNKHNRAFY